MVEIPNKQFYTIVPNKKFPINLLGYTSRKSLVVNENIITDEVVNILIKDNEIEFIIIVNDKDEIIGCIQSKNLLNLISSKFGHHLYGNKPINRVYSKIPKEFLIIDGNKPIRSIVSKIFKTKVNITITLDGKIYGATNPEIIYSALLKIIEEDSKETGRLQNMIINKSIYPSNIIEYRFFSNPSLNAGGDFIFIKDINEEEAIVVISDVSGKGTSASIITSMLSIFFKNISSENKLTNDRIKEHIVNLNNTIIEFFEYEKYITMTLCLVNKNQKTISVYNMGHQQTYIFNKDEITQKKSLNLPIGIAPLTKDTIKQEDILIKEDSKIFLFTDGAVEVKNNEGAEYGEKRIEAILSSYDDIDKIYSYLKEDLISFSEEEYQLDDISFVIFKLKN